MENINSRKERIFKSNFASTNELAYREDTSIKSITNSNINNYASLIIQDCANLTEISLSYQDQLEHLEIIYEDCSNTIELNLLNCTLNYLMIKGAKIKINIFNCFISTHNCPKRF